MTDTIILAIESSCDETAVAILKNETELLSNVVYSQIKVHQEFGGVIPEVASRIHVEKITYVIKQALREANVTMDDIDAIGITFGPGLIGSLHVGLQAAKTLAWMYNLPLIPVHHIAGHIYANAYVVTLKYPLLAIVVSGGHSELILMNKENDFKVIATTVDDAIGEAYDKVARVMSAGYPGGPVIDKLAKEGKPHYQLPKVKTANENEFSFSGLKSAVIQCVARETKQGNEININDLAYAFQERALEQILEKTELMINEHPVQHVVLAGGVAANSKLREDLKELMSHYPDIDLTIPPMWCCTDNAAMIAMAAAVNYRKNILASEDLGAKSTVDIELFHQE